MRNRKLCKGRRQDDITPPCIRCYIIYFFNLNQTLRGNSDLTRAVRNSQAEEFWLWIAKLWVNLGVEPNIFCLELALGFGYCFMVLWFLRFPYFTASVSVISFYTEQGRNLSSWVLMSVIVRVCAFDSSAVLLLFLALSSEFFAMTLLVLLTLAWVIVC